jgi:hypothetical protein
VLRRMFPLGGTLHSQPASTTSADMAVFHASHSHCSWRAPRQLQSREGSKACFVCEKWEARCQVHGSLRWAQYVTEQGQREGQVGCRGILLQASERTNMPVVVRARSEG